MGVIRIRTTKGNHRWKSNKENYEEAESQLIGGHNFLCLRSDPGEQVKASVIRMSDIVSIEYWDEED